MTTETDPQATIEPASELAERVLTDPAGIAVELERLRTENEELQRTVIREKTIRYERGAPVLTTIADVLDVLAANAENGNPEAVRLLNAFYTSDDRARAAIGRQASTSSRLAVVRHSGPLNG